MFGNILSRVIAGVVTLVILTGFRFYLAYYMLTKVHAMHNDSPYQASSRLPIDYSRVPVSPPEHSDWVVFSETDPATGTRTRHAKLAGFNGAPTAPAQQTVFLELTAGQASGNHAFVALPDGVPCQTLTTLSVKIDARAPVQVAVTPHDAPHCLVEIAAYENFMELLRDAGVMVVQGGNAAPVTFTVGGLSWD